MDDMLEGLLAGAADGCLVVVGAFLALVLLGALVSLLFEPASWLLLLMVGSWRQRSGGGGEAGLIRPLVPR